MEKQQLITFTAFPSLQLHLQDAVKLTRKEITIRASFVYSVQVSGSVVFYFCIFQLGEPNGGGN
jgi:hypothetical protein